MKAMAAMNEHKEESPMGIDGRDRGDSENSPRSVPDGVNLDKKRISRSSMEELSEIQKTGHFLPVGDTNMDPYLLFWNNSKKGESVVKVVQDIILMSISKEINATHFGYG